MRRTLRLAPWAAPAGPVCGDAVADTWIELGLSGITKRLSMMITGATDGLLIGIINLVGSAWWLG
jgi:hypothetical protein